ncbi:hypothetical protein [Lacipirellula parvula]|uniref:Uncharacterized protein n=1 Tax=Lacipirellula parvula TaxID=2650471 RepID=A0A5K7XCV7_9BACT|nr:hypothetical protein [Lacipirellula parvula]BBO34215.1 hypothetical protein PLANPX_3827 [Lacipirellula parvula]
MSYTDKELSPQSTLSTTFRCPISGRAFHARWDDEIDAMQAAQLAFTKALIVQQNKHEPIGDRELTLAERSAYYHHRMFPSAR